MGMAWGCREVKKRVPRACRCAMEPPRPPPPATSAGQPTVCVCAPHSPAHFAGCAAREAGAGSGVRERREPARDATWAAVDHRILVSVRSPGWRGERALEPKRCASKRNRKFADGGLPAGKKIEQLVFQSQARRKAGRGAGGRASRLGTPGPSQC